MSDLAEPAGLAGRPARPVGPPPRGAARRHGVFVRILRWLLPLIMVGVAALLVGLVLEHSARRRAASHREAQAPIRMLNPKFFGRDNQGRPYILGASQAARDEASLELVRLRDPSVTLDMDGPHPSTLTADTGVYREDTRILYLKGHVKADNAKTSKFDTDEAVVNTQTGVVTGPAALSSETPVGDLQSRSFDVFDKGNRVVFKGGVHARLNGR
jgi:lipopolysaccharide export system protein LptC